jgi:hypothetical protein
VVDAGRIDGEGERVERPSGLRTGSEDCVDRRLSDRGDVSMPLRHGEGVVKLSGLKLCPTTVSFMLTLEFQRGFTAGLSVFGVMERSGV